ncbi:hypothetical protein [Paludibacterium paludis]|nr:hypothetical protein [Paludibacterium paludis]
MMNKKNTALLFLGSLFLASCGGGGGGGSGGGSSSGSSSAVTTPSKPEGAYIGNTSDGNDTWTLVLDNDQLFSIYGRTVNSQFQVSGFVTGKGVASNGSYPVTETVDFNYTDVLRGSATFTYVAGKSLAGSFSEAGRTVSFTSQATKTSVYDYAQPARLATVGGTWTLADLTGTWHTLTIGGDSTLRGSTPSGCVYTGTIAPRGNKNVFDVALTFGAAPCRYPGLKQTGVAVSYTLPNGMSQMMLAATDAAQANGTLLIGSR